MNDKVINGKVLILPIGSKIKIPDDFSRQNILPNFSDIIKIELYCPKCKANRIFSCSKCEEIGSNLKYYDTNTIKVLLNKAMGEHLYYKFNCELNHKITVIFEIEDSTSLIKIGQYPEPLLVDSNNNNEILNELDEENREYYKNAYKAYKNNLNIAAFLYLRRIFESLVQKSVKSSSNDYDGMKIKEIIYDLIKNDLINPLLGDNGYNVLYSLISDGIHNLKEDECREQFELLKESIEIILEDEIYKKKQEKRKKQIGNKLSNENSNKKTIKA